MGRWGMAGGIDTTVWTDMDCTVLRGQWYAWWHGLHGPPPTQISSSSSVGHGLLIGDDLVGLNFQPNAPVAAWACDYGPDSGVVYDCELPWMKQQITGASRKLS